MPNRFINDTHKACSKCGDIKKLSDFYYRSDHKHLLSSHCRICVGIKSVITVEANPEKKRLRDIEYSVKNKEKRTIYRKKYQSDNKKIRSKKDNYKYHNDAQFRLNNNIRTRIRMALKRQSKSESTNALVGCNMQFLRVYLESKFKDGMSWDNYGKWQVDHIIPCSSFDLTVKENQFICFNYKNLQPLWAEENKLKGAKMPIEKEVCHR